MTRQETRAMTKTQAIVLAERIESRILLIRGHKVMLDRDLAALYGVSPYDWLERGIRRYGFHGINHLYCAECAARLLRLAPDSLRIVTCHLGSGCSLAAIHDGCSVDTTMGWTYSIA